MGKLNMNAPNTDRLLDVFRAVFELSPGTAVREMPQQGSPKWDSLGHVTLVTAIESEFGLSLDAADQLRMTSYATTSTLLEEKGL
jgi:acyl carrier protein